MVLYGIITWYIDAIHPGEFGSPQPFYFPFLVVLLNFRISNIDIKLIEIFLVLSRKDTGMGMPHFPNQINYLKSLLITDQEQSFLSQTILIMQLVSKLGT